MVELLLIILKSFYGLQPVNRGTIAMTENWQVRETHNRNVEAELGFHPCGWILMLQTNNIKDQIYFAEYLVSMWYNHERVGWKGPSEVSQASFPPEAGLCATLDQVSHSILFYERRTKILNVDNWVKPIYLYSFLGTQTNKISFSKYSLPN